MSDASQDKPPVLPLPHPHYMAFAPLDAWAKLLTGHGRAVSWIRPRYWPRLGFALFTSALATVGTLPERLVVGLVLAWRGRGGDGPRLEHGPGALVILGYFRSGTTHLHYLLSCDPRFVTPTWCQTLCPQGFVLTWGFLRLFMIPFLSATRPQDDVAIGPEWPAEDDFACNNWTAASSLASRFVVPGRHGHFSRYHDLSRLSPGELAGWRRVQWAFLQKLAWLNPGRAILLKSPSHTARVAELARLMPGAKFVHIARDPAAVIQSNVNMAQRLGVFNLEDPPAQGETRRRVVEEYLASEEKYLAESAALPAGSLVEIRYEDLVADPIGTLERVYGELGIEWSVEARRRVLTYLTSVSDYRAANARDKKAAERGGAAGDVADEPARIAALVRRFGHDRPAIAAARPPRVDLGGSAGRTRGATLAMVAIVPVAIVAWLLYAWVARDRSDWLIWPLGLVIGYMGITLARQGTARLGVIAAACVGVVYLAIVVPGTFLGDYAHRGAEFPVNYRAGAGEARAFGGLSPWIATSRWEWDHILKSSWRGATAMNNIFWLFMGLVTAYRFASRTHVTPPGR